MTSSSRARSTTLTAIVCAIVVGLGLASPAAADDDQVDRQRLSGRQPAPEMQVARSTDTTVSRHVKVQWKGNPKPRQTKKRVPIPGIGQLIMVCRHNAAFIRIQPSNPQAETQMWMSKYEDKQGHAAVAVKNVRVYRFEHVYDTSNGGTGVDASEGLNQQSPLENFQKGYANGVISQRPGRNVAAGLTTLEPVTTFKLNWYWNGFRYPPRYRFCKIDAVFLTKINQQTGVNWHGESNAPGNLLQSSRVGTLGSLQLRCETRNGNKLVSFVPDNPAATSAYIETVTGEGRVERHVRDFSIRSNRQTGKIGPFPLPNNGMMRLYLRRGKTTIPIILSSYYVTNNPDPRRNLCEIGAGVFPR